MEIFTVGFVVGFVAFWVGFLCGVFVQGKIRDAEAERHMARYHGDPH